MKALSQRIRSERGMAMVITLVILLMLGLIGISSVKDSNTDMGISESMTKRTRSFYTADGGLDLALALMAVNSSVVRHDSLLSIINADTSLGTGYFKVSMDTTYPRRTVTAWGYDGKGRSAVAIDVLHSGAVINPWDNAIFAGVGQTGKGIAGNVSIHGSVHILGEEEPYTDLNGNHRWDTGEPYSDENGDAAYTDSLSSSDIAYDAGGGAGVYNNYSGMPASISGRVPALATITYGGETVYTLNAKFRTKHGRVDVSGSSTIGTANATGGSPQVQETMTAVYVNDGFGGNKGVASVFSDNNPNQGYDLPEGTLDFPSLNDSSNGFANHKDYLNANAAIITGDVTFKVGTAYSSPANAKGQITITAAGAITITGIVMFTGNVIFDAGSGGNKDTPFLYDGRGTVVAQNNMTINTHVLSKGAFPTDDVMGFIAYKDMGIGTGNGASHLDFTGAFYAMESIPNEKQNDLAGAMVSSCFDMKNVPDIYQVPSLVANMPPGMPGAQSVGVLSWQPISSTWREIYPVY